MSITFIAGPVVWTEYRDYLKLTSITYLISIVGIAHYKKRSHRLALIMLFLLAGTLNIFLNFERQKMENYYFNNLNRVELYKD